MGRHCNHNNSIVMGLWTVAVGDEVTFNKVKEGLLNKYPSLDVSARKAEFKEWAREIIESQ